MVWICSKSGQVLRNLDWSALVFLRQVTLSALLQIGQGLSGLATLTSLEFLDLTRHQGDAVTTAQVAGLIKTLGRDRCYNSFNMVTLAIRRSYVDLLDILLSRQQSMSKLHTG